MWSSNQVRLQKNNNSSREKFSAGWCLNNSSTKYAEPQAFCRSTAYNICISFMHSAARLAVVRQTPWHHILSPLIFTRFLCSVNRWQALLGKSGNCITRGALHSRELVLQVEWPHVIRSEPILLIGMKEIWSTTLWKFCMVCSHTSRAMCPNWLPFGILWAR